jgi:ankyrin repeat protein
VCGAIEAAAQEVGNVLAKRAEKKPKIILQNELSHAARNGDVVEFRRIVVAHLDDVDVNGRDTLGIAPIHAAIESGQLIVVEVIATLRAANVNVRDENGNSPLMVAVRYGQQRIVAYLVQCSRAEVNCQNTEGKTALHLAEEVPEVIREAMVLTLALSEKVKCDVKDLSGRTPFQDSPEILQRFRTKQAEYERKRADRRASKDRL